MLSQMQQALNELISTVPLVNSGHDRFRCQLRRGFTSCADELTCRTFYFGSLIQALNAKGLYPLHTTATYRGRLTDFRTLLIDSLSAIKPPSASFASFGHMKCSPQDTIKGGLLAITPDVPLTEAQEKHLSQQALRSGLAVQAQFRGRSEQGSTTPVAYLQKG